MSLLAYNLTIAPLPLAAGVPIATLPASTSAGSRGPALNVTGELKGQLAPAFALLQAQVAAGLVEYEWTDLPEYGTFSLIVGSAQAEFGDLDEIIYVSTAGNDNNSGTNPTPTGAFLTMQAAFTKLPAVWKKSMVIQFGLGTFPTNGLPLVRIPAAVGPGATPLQILGTAVDSGLGSMSILQGSTLKQFVAVATTVLDDQRGAYLRNTVTGARALVTGNAPNTPIAGQTTFDIIGDGLTPGAQAGGNITTITGAILIDGETFTLNDGANPAVVFEFDSNGIVTPGNVGVTFTIADTADQVRDSIISAVSGAALLNISAFDGGPATVGLTNDVFGPIGNIAITDTVANAGFVVTGMAGGTLDTFIIERPGTIFAVDPFAPFDVGHPTGEVGFGMRDIKFVDAGGGPGFIPLAVFIGFNFFEAVEFDGGANGRPVESNHNCRWNALSEGVYWNAAPVNPFQGNALAGFYVHTAAFIMALGMRDRCSGEFAAVFDNIILFSNLHTYFAVPAIDARNSAIVMDNFTLLNVDQGKMDGGYFFLNGTIQMHDNCQGALGFSANGLEITNAPSDGVAISGLGNLICANLFGAGNTGHGISLDAASLLRTTPGATLITGAGGFGVSTALTDNPLSAVALTVNVVSTTGYPVTGLVKIDSELIAYTGTTPTSFTGCTRGSNDTTAAVHLLGALVYQASGFDVLVGAVTKTYGALPYGEVNGSGPTGNRAQ